MYMGKCLIPDGEAGSDVSWTVLGRGAFNGRPVSGPGLRQFVNKLRMTNSVPIGSSTVSTKALVGANEQRALLILQNNSTATSPDSAPTFYFGFGTQPTVGYDLALPPGVGMVLDTRVPADSIYVAFGPFSNGGGTALVQGVCKEGGVTDPAGDTVNMTDTSQMQRLITLLQQALHLQ
jgi:hypothetical protein